MRIGELATATKVPLATLKYYLREGLLHPGVATAVNQAVYDDGHVQRVRLVRALLHMGHLSIADARQVIAAVDNPNLGVHDMFGVAQDALVPGEPVESPAMAAAMVEVDAFIRRHHLRVRPQAAVRRMLAEVLVAASELFGVPTGQSVGADGWDDLMPQLVALAEAEVGSLPDDSSRASLMEGMVGGTVLFEVGLAAVRRMALEHASAERFD